MSRIINHGNNEIETIIDRYDGGITNDPRDTRDGVNQIITNFDVLTNPRKITPYRNSENADSASATRQHQNFCIALRTGTTYALFALGRQTSLDRPEINYMDLENIGGVTWSSTSKNQSGRVTTTYNLFVYYRATGKIYGAHTGYIYAYDPTDVDAITVGEQALTYTHITQGIVHSEDGILYFAYHDSATGNSYVASKNGSGAWNLTALTLPKGFIPTSVVEKENWLVITLASSSGAGSSIVIYWDRDAISWNEMVELGEGSVIVAENLQGTLVTISQSGGTSSSFSGIPNGVIRTKNKVVIRFLPSTGSDTIELESTSSPILLTNRQKINERLYFMMSVTIDGVVRDGVWSVGRNKNGQWALVHERTPNNDTALTSGIPKGFFYVGDYLLQSYVDNGTYALSKTNDQEAYATSVVETCKSNAGDSSKKKDLLGFSVMTDPLDDSPAASVVVKYKKDNESSYTTFMTHDTDGAISDSAVNTEATGAVLPKDYKEISFKIESTGAVITGHSFREKITNKRPYN